MTTTPPPDLGPKTARNLGLGMIVLLIVAAIVTLVLIAIVISSFV